MLYLFLIWQDKDIKDILGSGTHADLYKEVSEALTYMKVQMACVVGNYVVTHAGITREWAYRFLTPDQSTWR